MEIVIENLNKSFDGQAVLTDVGLHFREGGIYALMGKSGTGKTTLLNVLMGLMKADQGQIRYLLRGAELRTKELKMSCVFQEDRLCESFSAVDNVRMVLDKSVLADIRDALLELLPGDSLDKPVSRLSGGMRRRVAIVRAMLAEADFILMDEPFSGLDEQTREKTIEFILSRRENRTLLVVTHQAGDAKKLGGEVVWLPDEQVTVKK